MSVASVEPAVIRLVDGTHILIHRTTDVCNTSINGTPGMVLQNDESISETPDSNSWVGTSLFPDVSESQNGSLEQNTPSSDAEDVDVLGKVVLSYKCNFCPFLAEEKEELLNHFSCLHNVEKSQFPAKIKQDPTLTDDTEKPSDFVEPLSKEVYQCGECESVFHSFGECRQHMFSDHDLVVAEAEVTDETTTTSTTKSSGHNEKTRSKNAQTSENKLKCVVRGCQFVKFTNEESLNIHIRCHEGDSKEFRCFLCSESFDRWRNCALHLWKSHEVDAGLLSCPVCLVYKTITPVKLENHVKVHREDRPYVCTEFNCGKSFKQSSQLRNHRVLHIDRKTGKVPRCYSTQKCDICDKNLADSKCLKKHIQAVHSKMRPYVCNVCGHTSARKAMLQMHSRQHTGEKPYSCDMCTYRTGDHNSLRRHKMRHTGDRPYQCPHCPYASIQSNSYKNHLRSKHPGKCGVHSCNECDFRTVNEEAYLLHKKDHLNGRIPTSSQVEIFPENEMAANLIYNCFSDVYGGTWKANVTGSTTSADGTMQTITIQLPGTESVRSNADDEETQHFYALQMKKGKLDDDDDEDDEDEIDTIDTGGITIPAEPDSTC